jgi:prephenate dehydrogenase
MHATIIGIDGGMGQWMNNHLTGLGYTVTGFDERRGDPPSILSKADLVVVSVPIPVTAEIIMKALKHMRPGACIMEIASLKSGVHRTLVEASRLGFKALCVHPMFGPSVINPETKTVAVIPVKDADSEIRLTSKMFPSASIEKIDVENHDRLMSIILSLPYLVNMAIAGCLVEEDLVLLRRLSGTSFLLQYVLTQSIVQEKTELVETLIAGNKFLEATSNKFIENIEKIQENAGTQEFQKLHSAFRDSLSRDPESDVFDDMRMEAYESIRGLLSNYTEQKPSR